ncbi:MAG: hypothetical protein VX871_06530 [Pseudomonadota bacterium]|nr:hypothetical protein [Pseudomonadota bacterium]
MKTVSLAGAFVLVLILQAAPAAWADANCGNPCDDNEVWTDKHGGKCLPKPDPKSQSETKTS